MTSCLNCIFFKQFLVSFKAKTLSACSLFRIIETRCSLCTLDAYPGSNERERGRKRKLSTGKIIVQGTIGGTDVRNETTRSTIGRPRWRIDLLRRAVLMICEERACVDPRENTFQVKMGSISGWPEGDGRRGAGFTWRVILRRPKLGSFGKTPSFKKLFSNRDFEILNRDTQSNFLLVFLRKI